MLILGGDCCDNGEGVEPLFQLVSLLGGGGVALGTGADTGWLPVCAAQMAATAVTFPPRPPRAERTSYRTSVSCRPLGQTDSKPRRSALGFVSCAESFGWSPRGRIGIKPLERGLGLASIGCSAPVSCSSAFIGDCSGK